MISHSNYLFVLPLSSFPFLRTLSFFSSIIGVFLCIKFEIFPLILAITCSFFSGILWWNCYCYEFFEEGSFDQNLSEGLKFSFLLFVSSEVFFFFSFFWGYFHFYLRPARDLGLEWPPYSLLMFDFMEVPLLNTMILLTSGVTVTCAHFFLFKRAYSKVSVYLFLTFLLGGLFTYFQFLEYTNSFFRYNDRCFGSCFFTLTGFHGIHVIVGRFFLLFVFFRFLLLPPFSSSSPLSFELSRWYWHFVDVVWIFLYFFVYVYRCS